MKIKIKSRSISDIFIWVSVMVAIFSTGIIALFEMNNIIKYSIDALLVMTTIVVFSRFKLNKISKSMIIYVTIFITMAFIVYMFNFQSIINFFWGMRNNFRFYLFFILCLVGMKETDINYYEKFFDILFWFNAPICFVQYFILGYSMDNIGGIFGVKSGCNGYLNIFLVIIVTRVIIRYISKETSIINLVAVIITSILIGAIAELKFFYVELAIIMMLSVLITNFSFRKLMIIIISIVAIIVGTTLLVKIFPNWEGAFSFDKMLEISSTEEGYTGTGDLNRLNSIQVLSENILKQPLDRLFGIGIGNADYSTNIETLQSQFYKTYRKLHYTWMSVSFMFVECGYAGLALFEGFFVLIFAKLRKLKKQKPEYKTSINTSIVLAIMAIVISIYNSSLRTEAGYMIYLFLALPFCSLNTSKKTREQKTKLKIHF